jgi:predicted Zn-dependent protease with MMP-like domain
MVEVDPERFEVMVSEALDGIPEELGELISNVTVTVQHDGGPAGLLGLYRGMPLTRRSTFYAGALPDRITIYRRAICAVCNSDSEVVEQVRRTVIHEVGHHFGIGDARLRARLVSQLATSADLGGCGLRRPVECSHIRADVRGVWHIEDHGIVSTS